MGGYMSWQEAEARSVYASNPTTAGYMGGSYSSQRWHDEQRQRDTERQQQQRYQDNRPAGYVGGTFNPETGETTGGHPAEAQMAADRARSGATTGNDIMNMGYTEYRRSQAVEEAQGRYSQTTGKDYFDRPDIIPPTDRAQLNLIQQGYTAEQSAEMLRVDAARRQDYAAERKYETLRQQANAATVSTASGYHHWAKDTGLPQAPNPFEYAADLALYAEKGEPRKRSEAFSPVDYGVLNLKEGKGGQDYVWLSDSERNYDLRGAMDVIAQAKRSGTMGAYGQLGAPSSSKYGVLSLADQQDIARYVNENPEHQAMGFRTNDSLGTQRTDEILSSWRGAYVSSLNPTAASAASAAPVGSKYLTDAELFANPVSVKDTYRPSDLTLWAMGTFGNTEKSRVGAIGNSFIKLTEFVTPGSTIKTTTGQTQTVDRSRLDPSGGAVWTAKYIDPATNKPTDTMKFKVGDPYTKDGIQYQDYETSDLSKVTINPVKTESIAGESGFDRGERRFAEKYTMGGEQYQPINTGSPLDYPQNIVRGAIRGLKEKPLTAGINVGVGLATTALTLGAINPATEGLAVTAIAQGSKWALPAAALNFAVTKAAPVALVTLYAADVGAGYTNNYSQPITRESAYAGSKRVGYETIPFIVGAGSYGVMNKRLSLVETGYQNALKAGETKSRVDYFIKQPAHSNRFTMDYNQIKLEALSQNQPRVPTESFANGRTTTSKDVGAMVEKIKLNNAKKWGLDRPNYLSTQSAEMPKITAGTNPAPAAPAEPALGRNVKGKIEFGVRDYIGYKTGKFVAETKGRFDTDLMKNVAPETSSVNPPQLTTAAGKRGMTASDVMNAEPVTNEAWFNSRAELARSQGRGGIRLESRPMETNYDYSPKISNLGVPKGAEVPTNEPHFNALNKVYAGDTGQFSNFGIGRDYAGMVEKSHVPKSLEASVPDYGTPESYFQSLGESAYGKPQPVRAQALDFLIKAGGLTDKVKAKVSTPGKFGLDTGEGGGIPKITKGTPPGGAGTTGVKFPRMTGTKIVGGKSVPSLAKESSLPKEVTGKFTASGGTTGKSAASVTTQRNMNIGQRTDFRNAPRGSMQPFSKMAGMSGILTEELPLVEGMPKSPQQRMNIGRGQSGMISVVQPDLTFGQNSRSRQELGLAVAPALASRFGQRSEIRQAMSLTSGEQTRTRMTRQGLGQDIYPVRAVMPLRGITGGQLPKTRQDITTGLTTTTRTRQGTETIPRQGSDLMRITRQDQLFRQDQMFRQETLTGTDKIRLPQTTFLPLGLPMLGGGYLQGSQRARSGRRHVELFSTQVGQLSAAMFSGGGLNMGGGGFGEESAPRRKSVYGNYRGQFTTGRGKTIRVKPMPRSYSNY